MQFSSFGEVPVVINDEERDVFLRELTEIGGGGGGGEGGQRRVSGYRPTYTQSYRCPLFPIYLKPL